MNKINQGRKMDKEYLTTFQAAQLLAVTPDSILKWIKSGILDARRTPGGHHRISKKSIDKLISKTKNSNPCKEELQKKVIQYCWEFNLEEANCSLNCQDCLVYKARAKRCFELSDFPKELGIQKRYCKTTCDKCEYYKLAFSQN